MSLLGASFQIGRSALAAYQSAAAIAGQNVANLANPNYARQTGRLSALVGGPVLGGVTPGAGVQLDRLLRHVDEALEGRLRTATGARGAADVLYRALSEAEGRYNELSDTDLSSLLSGFFSQFAALETAPTESGQRGLVLSNAEGLAQSLRRQRSGLLDQVENLNREAETVVGRANDITAEIASLNELIVTQESDGRTSASALRDRRDGLLRELSEIMDVRSREHSTGAVSVYVGSSPLVDFNRSRELIAERAIDEGVEIARVRFADDHSGVSLAGGSLGGIQVARDVHLRAQLNDLDQLANGLIYEVNRIHSTGVGQIGRDDSLGEYAVLDSAAALNTPQAGLPFPVQNGTFIVHVRDRATGQTITRQIEVDLDGLGGDDTSLDDLAEALGNVPGLSASVTPDRRLSLSASAGREFWFTEDSSGALAALGVNSLLTGVNASDIAVSQALVEDPRLIAASVSGQLNDGSNAGRMALLGADDAASALLSGRSVSGHYESMIAGVAVDAAQALTQFEAADVVHAGLTSQREAISGVSLEEETVKLMQYEAAFQGATRYLSVLDEMSNELLSLV